MELLYKCMNIYTLTPTMIYFPVPVFNLILIVYFGISGGPIPFSPFFSGPFHFGGVSPGYSHLITIFPWNINRRCQDFTFFRLWHTNLFFCLGTLSLTRYEFLDSYNILANSNTCK